jgi:choline dehydrogenase-like flavoprotein
VSAGSIGCTLASRLSQDSSVQVLLLKAWPLQITCSFIAGCEEPINGDPLNVIPETGERFLAVAVNCVSAAIRQEWPIWNKVT